MAKRTVRQRAATAALVARNALSRAGGAITTRARSVGRRVAATRVVQGATRVIAVAAPRGSRRRRVVSAIARGGSAIAIAQARILPAAVGGYAIAALERNQRLAHAKSVPKEKGGLGTAGALGTGALIKDPTTRIVAELAVLAFAASKTQGIAKEAFCGMAGGAGALYEMYSVSSGGNPDDGYIGVVKAGGAGV